MGRVHALQEPYITGICALALAISSYPQTPHAPARMLPAPTLSNASHLPPLDASRASHPAHAAPPTPPNAAAATIDSDGGSSSSSCPGANHTVVSGDTCLALAGRYGTGVGELQALNPGLNCSGGLGPGQVLCITAVTATDGE